MGLMLALSLTTSAQNDGFAFGFKVGPNLGWTGSTTAAAVREGSRAGFDLGVVAEFYFAENYAISTGINVGFMGGHYSFDNGRMVSDSLNPDPALEIYRVDRVYKTTIYEIPIMLKMVTNELGNLPLRVYAQVGAGFGYAQKVKVKDSYEDFNGDTYIASNKEYSNFRTSLKIGAGAQYALDESTRVFLGVYFSHDFINNINSIAPNHYKFYFDGDEKVGERDPKLNVLQNRVGIEAGVLF